MIQCRWGVRDQVLQGNVFRAAPIPAGLTPNQRDRHDANVSHSAGQPFFAKVSRKGTEHIPSTYVRFLDDEVISAERQLAMIAEMNAKHRIDVRGYHNTMLSNPEMVAGIVAAVAGLSG